VAPPCTLSLLGSASVFLSHATGTEAKASLTSNRSMSSIDIPAFLSGRAAPTLPCAPPRDAATNRRRAPEQRKHRIRRFVLARRAGTGAASTRSQLEQRAFIGGVCRDL